MAFTPDNIKLAAAEEAVTQLGYLKPEAISTIVALMIGGMTEHPRSITTAYRKEGVQLSRDEKKALGLRANAFLSRRAFDDLTDDGKRSPLAAHEITLLRAVFTESRFRRVTDPIPDELQSVVAGFKYETNSGGCPFCQRMDGQVVAAEDVAILPAAECRCEAANYGVRLQIDWLKVVD